MKIEQAAAIANVGQVIVNSAKVENDHLKITGGLGSGFIPNALPAPKAGQARLVQPLGNK